MLYKCQWCGMTHDDYDSFAEHIDLHASIDILNGDSFRCPLCKIIILTTYESWKSHEQAHKQADERLNDSRQPSATKRAKIADDRTDTSSLNNTDQYHHELPSPVPGPSHLSPEQTGSGTAETNQSQLSYKFEKIGEKTFKNGVIDRHYRVKFDPHQSLDGKNLSSMHEQLEDMFDDVIDQASANLNDNDLMRLIVHHPDLTNNIHIPLRKVENLSGHDVLEYVENVMSSHQNLDMNDSFNVDVGTMELPKGGTRLPITSLAGADNSIERKRSVIEVKSSDNSCLPLAVGIAFATANRVTTQEWKELTKNDQGLSIDKLVLKYRKCPDWYRKDLIRKTNKQNLFIRSLCHEANVDYSRPLTICDISQFEELLSVDILVVSSRLGNKFIRVPTDENSNKQRLYLYLVEYEKTYHFHVISSINAFYSRSKKDFCQKCLKPCNSKHQCAASCFVCKRKDCFASGVEMSCRHCHFTCRSKSCFDHHKLDSNKQKQSLCHRWWKCTNCKQIVDTNKLNVEEHVCDTYFCKSCEKMVDTNSHNCYIRCCKSQESKPRYVFYDFECEQEGNAIIQCEEGYLPTNVKTCTLCKTLKTMCTKCSVCKNCQRADCGKYTHVPILVVASTVCEVCINDCDFSPESKCDNCGTRCKKCNQFDKKENCFERAPCRDTCGFREIIFRGQNVKQDFGKWLINPAHKGFCTIGHNAKGYDNYFLLEYLIDNSIRPDIIYNGSKIMYMHVKRGLDIRFLDSLNFLPMKLAKLPEAFGFTQLKKGYFPHLMTKKEFFSYSGAYPAAEFYSPDYMSPEERSEFLKWHEGKLDSGEQFDFQTEILEYCRSDVDILRKACLKFREIIQSVTGREEVFYDENAGAPDTRLSGGVDPFSQVTIASVCMKIFKTKFLTENWQVKVTKDTDVSDWLPATYQDGTLSVFIDGVYMSWDQLQQNGCTIDEKRYVSSPIAQVPADGYSSRDTYSKASIRWLEWYMYQQKLQGNQLHIRHALNGGEIKIPGTNYYADGYAEQLCVSKTTGKTEKKVVIYNYNGCFYHGCKLCFPNQRRQIKLPRTNQSLEELFALTLKREQCIRFLGFEQVTIWEHEFNQLLQTNETVANFVNSLDIQDRLEPRQAFFGGRVNATKLHYKVSDEEQIHYYDVTSLYPFVQKYSIFPLKEPQILTSDFTDISNYFGIAKIKILPPKGLYHPVLPLKINGKLLFTLCRKCAEQQNQETCTCSDEKRCLIGTWCTPEIKKAIEKGYEVLKIYEVYHWDESSQFNKETGETGLFAQYVNVFLKIKQEASGWPEWVKTDEDRSKYITEYAKNEGINLDSGKISKNPALRSIAKLILNSFWGKFGQNMRKPKTSFFHESEADKFFQCISDPSKTMKDFHIISHDMLQLTWEESENILKEDYQTNVFIAAFTTCWARLRLYSLLEMLGRRVLYFDTDSVIFVSRPADINPKTGPFLGELTNELKRAGDYITEFVSGGPKNYAYKTFLGEQVCKVKGFSLNYVNSQLINFSSMLQLVSTPKRDNLNSTRSVKLGKRKAEKKKEDKIILTNPRKITRQKLKRKIYNREERKEYKVVYDKRVLQKGSFDTRPYGF